MQTAQRRPMTRAREDQLVAAAEAGLQMRQHRADQDPKIGPCHRLKNPHGYALRRLSQIVIS